MTAPQNDRSTQHLDQDEEDLPLHNDNANKNDDSNSTTNTPPPPGNPLPLQASRQDLIECQFSSWYTTFRYLSKDDAYQGRTNVTIKSEIVRNLPDDFTRFLLEDGIRLPRNATRLSSCALSERQNDDENDDDCDDCASQYDFPQLTQSLVVALNALGGAVVPKLNWSTPKDATWVNEGTLKCQTPGDVYLLLKSSDFVLHDLETLQAAISKNSNEEGSSMRNNEAIQKSNNEDTITENNQFQLELVLRKWCNFYPSMEFRCFVRDNELIGISQRNHTQHYPHLLKDKFQFQSLILDFHENVICQQFASNRLQNYVFDVYIDRSNRVWIVDFNVWSIQTDALLYTWEELVDIKIPPDSVEVPTDWPELRVVENALEVRQDPLASYRAPIDTVNLASNQQPQQVAEDQGGGTFSPATFEAFMAMCQKPSDLDDSNNSE